MSKSRGTFILASEFAAKMSHPLAREYLRFYIASKLAGGSGDIDFNPDEFCGRVNSTLVNNIGNLHHRTFVFIDRYFESTVPDEEWDADMARTVNKTAAEISQCYMRADYKTAIEKIHALASAGNKYYQDSAPWALIKTDRKKAGQVMTTCVNLVRSLAVFLKPVVPSICAAVEQQFNASFCWNDFVFSIRGNKMAETKKIALPVTLEDFTALTGAAPAVASAGEKQEVAGDIIDISDFAKVQLRIGTVESAEPVPKSDKLLKLVVNAGNEKRQIVAGLAKHYSPDDLTGKQIVFIANLKPAKLMGLKSEGMVLAASGEGTLSVLCPHRPVNAGAKIS
jgi:methionyl-tRNA synthetase